LEIGSLDSVGGMAVAFILALIIYELIKQGTIYLKNGKNGNGKDEKVILLRSIDERLKKMIETDEYFKINLCKGLDSLARMERNQEKFDDKIDVCMHELRSEFQSLRER